MLALMVISDEEPCATVIVTDEAWILPYPELGQEERPPSRHAEPQMRPSASERRPAVPWR